MPKEKSKRSLIQSLLWSGKTRDDVLSIANEKYTNQENNIRKIIASTPSASDKIKL
ncbi:MAG: hypothetical protein JXR91_17810 [Deltaproteobacteria bacterium]|nr:hypothetical protein [Deltaproteobacteria bacterium]